MSNDDNPRKPAGIIGIAATGLLATGVGSLIAGVLAVLNGNSDGWGSGSSFQAAGVCGIAAALSFGLFLIAVLRK